MRRALSWLAYAIFCCALWAPSALGAQERPAPVAPPAPVAASVGADFSLPGVRIELEGAGEEEGNLAPALRLSLMLLALGLLPAAVLSATSFARIVIVMGFVRQALGTNSLPPNQIIIGLSLFLCLFTMAPTFERIRVEAYEPYSAGRMTDLEAVEAAAGPMRSFMARHTRASELELFVGMTQDERPRNFDEVPTLVLVPAFMLSELRTAFIMGALIYIPFIIVDIVAASVLMSMGMMMVPPAMIALPIKLLLFVLVDGWALVVGSLARSIVGGS